MRRYKDVDWELPEDLKAVGQGSLPYVQLALLMDLRDELKRSNNLLHLLLNREDAIPNAHTVNVVDDRGESKTMAATPPPPAPAPTKKTLQRELNKRPRR